MFFLNLGRTIWVRKDGRGSSAGVTLRSRRLQCTPHRLPECLPLKVFGFHGRNSVAKLGSLPSSWASIVASSSSEMKSSYKHKPGKGSDEGFLNSLAGTGSLFGASPLQFDACCAKR